MIHCSLQTESKISRCSDDLLRTFTFEHVSGEIGEVVDPLGLRLESKMFRKQKVSGESTSSPAEHVLSLTFEKAMQPDDQDIGIDSPRSLHADSIDLRTFYPLNYVLTGTDRTVMSDTIKKIEGGETTDKRSQELGTLMSSDLYTIFQA